MYELVKLQQSSGLEDRVCQEAQEMVGEGYEQELSEVSLFPLLQQ